MELVPPVARYAQVARILRHRIYAGDWASGSTLPGAPALAREYGVSQSVAQRALETLEAGGLVRMVSGRGSIVLPRRGYEVRALVPWTGAPPGASSPPAAEVRRLEAALRGQEGDGTGIVSVTAVGGVAVVVMAVEMPDAWRAEAHAGMVLRVACPGGWDLPGASSSARPA